jgi:hypothetical protein
VRVVLDPAGLAGNVLEFLLGDGTDAAFAIEQDGP